ncbi:hypothetical protein [Terrabacter carboxydivorans]|uniref:Polymerase nucleotidyl transferase domain-containing protein n=1 Tax=Terrabacter carboxydivorans TaxID=619730 RepID=A0ABN3MAA0_9MICO
MPSAPSQSTVPQRLLAFLDRLGAELDRRGDAVALLGLGSVGRDLHRLDEHSDADFFVVVDDTAARDRYLADIDWLEAAQPVVWSFENSDAGRKALLEGDLFAEYAVFTLAEMDTAGYPPGRLHWSRADAPAGLDEPKVPVPQPPSLAHEVGEAITNLYVGLHRDLRGERLTASRFIQGYAVDRWVTILGNLGLGRGDRQDVFVVDRGVERRFGPELLPLADLVPGYERNAHAAATLLALLEEHVELDPTIVAAVRDLIGRAATGAQSRATESLAGESGAAESGAVESEAPASRPSPAGGSSSS